MMDDDVLAEERRVEAQTNNGQIRQSIAGEDENNAQ